MPKVGLNLSSRMDGAEKTSYCPQSGSDQEKTVQDVRYKDAMYRIVNMPKFTNIGRASENNDVGIKPNHHWCRVEKKRDKIRLDVFLNDKPISTNLSMQSAKHIIELLHWWDVTPEN